MAFGSWQNIHILVGKRFLPNYTLMILNMTVKGGMR